VGSIGGSGPRPEASWGVVPLTFSNIVAVPRARTLAFAVFVVALLTAVPASAATRHVSRAGVDVGDCALAPCASFAYAYGRAGAGDVIRVAAGSYGRQSTPRGTKAVTFHGGPGVVLRQMVNDASNVTFDGISVNAGGVQTEGAAFELGGDGVTVRNASVGNVADEKAMLATGARHTVDNVTFHDAVYKTDGTHMECLYAIGVPGFTLRNSTFRDCAVMDVFFTYGTWWTPPPPAYGNVTIENNVFSHPEMENNGGWHYYSLYIGWIGPNGEAEPMSGWIVRNNTFESPAYISPARGSNGTRWVGNLGSWDCKPGIAFSYNVGEKCAGSDKQVSPASSAADRTAAFGWVNPARGDFRLRAGSPAINTGVANVAPELDRLGLVRDSRPDAGAYEFGAKAPGGGSGSGATSLRMLFAKLSPKVICKRPRRGCAGKARLRVGLSMSARVSVRIKRVRAGHRPRRVRSFGFVVAPRGAHKIKARRLKKGSYRVVVRAAGEGQRTRARSLRLRVR
jgi:hypothetical protein